MSETINFLLISSFKKLQQYSRLLEINNYEADDLFQDTVLRILEKKDLYNPDIDFIGWSKRIMKNVFLNKLRSEKIRQTDNIEDYLEIGKEESNEYKELVDTINKILDEQKRDSFWLMIDGYNYKEISKILSIPEGTVKSRIFNAKKILKEKIKDPRK